MGRGTQVLIFLLVLGSALVIEGVWKIKYTNARQRAAVGGAVGAYIGYKHAKEHKVASSLLGGVGGSLLGAALPYIGIVFGILLLLSIPIILANWDDFALDRTTDCAHKNSEPKGAKIIGNWSDYKCMTKAAAGTAWKYCFGRGSYSEREGMGCPGEERCCPTQVPVLEQPKKTPETKAVSDCGNLRVSPSKDVLSGTWQNYRCKTEKQAGAAWPKCLSRNQYSEIQGNGCQNNMKCCPGLF